MRLTACDQLSIFKNYVGISFSLFPCLISHNQLVFIFVRFYYGVKGCPLNFVLLTSKCSMCDGKCIPVQLVINKCFYSRIITGGNTEQSSREFV